MTNKKYLLHILLIVLPVSLFAETDNETKQLEKAYTESAALYQHFIQLASHNNEYTSLCKKISNEILSITELYATHLALNKILTSEKSSLTQQDIVEIDQYSESKKLTKKQSQAIKDYLSCLLTKQELKHNIRKPQKSYTTIPRKCHSKQRKMMHLLSFKDQ